MDILDQQIETLIQDAPSDGITANLVKAIAPLLKRTANQFPYPEYHVLQGKGGGWMTSTLSNRAQPEREKSVIYAFSTQDDAQEYQRGNNNSETLIVSVPIIQILFQLIAFKTVQSIIFFDHRGVSGRGAELDCQNWQRRVKAQVAAAQRGVSSTVPITPPPDIA